MVGGPFMNGPYGANLRFPVGAIHESPAYMVPGPTVWPSNARRYDEGRRSYRRGGYQPPADMVQGPTVTGRQGAPAPTISNY